MAASAPKKTKKAAKKKPPLTPLQRAAATSVLVGTFAGPDPYVTSRDNAGTPRTDSQSEAVKQEVLDRVIADVKAKGAGAYADACRKLKAAYPQVPTVQRLSCQESPAELVRMIANDSALNFSAGLTVAFDIDVGSYVNDAIAKVGGTIAEAFETVQFW
jgi:hypothetical protein